MARGDIKNTRLSLTYNQYTTLQPPSGDTWLVTGMASHHQTVQVYTQNNDSMMIDGNDAAASNQVAMFSPINGGTKMLINNSNYLKFLYSNTTSTPRYCTVFAVEV